MQRGTTVVAALSRLQQYFVLLFAAGSLHELRLFRLQQHAVLLFITGSLRVGCFDCDRFREI